MKKSVVYSVFLSVALVFSASILYGQNSKAEEKAKNEQPQKVQKVQIPATPETPAPPAPVSSELNRERPMPVDPTTPVPPGRVGKDTKPGQDRGYEKTANTGRKEGWTNDKALSKDAKKRDKQIQKENKVRSKEFEKARKERQKEIRKARKNRAKVKDDIRTGSMRESNPQDRK